MKRPARGIGEPSPPFDVATVETDVTLAEIHEFIREGREAGSAAMMVREKRQPPKRKSTKRKRPH